MVSLLRPGGGQFASAGHQFLALFGVVSLHRPEGGQFDRFFQKISIQRNSTLKAEARLKTIKSIEKKRMDWVLAALAALIGIKLGIGPAPGTISKNAAKWSIDYFRKRCERAIDKPLGEFEAMIIREGLRDIKPLVV